jgi:capsular exopolysaccharide synthesis family protein
MELTEIHVGDWQLPPEEQQGLQRYVQTIRERISLIAIVAAVTTLIALVYAFTATKMYEAQSEVLVTPVSADNPVYNTLGLIRESADPTRDVATASRLINNLDVAARVKDATHSSRSPQELLDSVSATPIAETNVIAVKAEDTSADGARRLANQFAHQAIAERTIQLHRQIDDLIPKLEAQVDPNAAGSAEIADELAQLRSLRASPDLTMRVQTRAALPTSPSSPHRLLIVFAGLTIGLILGLIAAFAAQVLDPRLRREAQLRRSYQLPILGRIPKESRSVENPLAPRHISSATGEAYRALRATLAGPRGRTPGQGKVILVTGSSASEGKTTTAINLATSLALAGSRVILIESDLRRPALAHVMGVRPENGGVVSVLIENTTLAESLVPSATYGPNLRLLLSDYEAGWIAELFSIPTAQRMIEDSRRMADYVIVDSAPLNEVVDALPLAQVSDDVLIVVRLGVTRLDKLSQLAELLAENGVRPVGFAVVGTPRPRRSEYHYYAEAGEAQDGQRHLLAGARRALRT